MLRKVQTQDPVMPPDINDTPLESGQVPACNRACEREGAFWDSERSGQDRGGRIWKLRLSSEYQLLLVLPGHLALDVRNILHFFLPSSLRMHALWNIRTP